MELLRRQLKVHFKRPMLPRQTQILQEDAAATRGYWGRHDPRTTLSKTVSLKIRSSHSLTRDCPFLVWQWASTFTSFSSANFSRSHVGEGKTIQSFLFVCSTKVDIKFLNPGRWRATTIYSSAKDCETRIYEQGSQKKSLLAKETFEDSHITAKFDIFLITLAQGTPLWWSFGRFIQQQVRFIRFFCYSRTRKRRVSCRTTRENFLCIPEIRVRRDHSRVFRQASLLEKSTKPEFNCKRRAVSLITSLSARLFYVLTGLRPVQKFRKNDRVTSSFGWYDPSRGVIEFFIFVLWIILLRALPTVGVKMVKLKAIW